MSKNLTTHEVAEMLRVHTKTLARWRSEGCGPKYIRAGRRVLYPAHQVNEWIETRAATKEEA